jgi:hypothetical protein
MGRKQTRWIALSAFLASLFVHQMAQVQAKDVSGQAVKEAIDRGRRYLISQQAAGGYWDVGTDGFRIGVTSMAVMALINSGMSPQDPPVKRALDYLRKPNEDLSLAHHETYQVALQIMALVSAREMTVDAARIALLAQRLERGQVKEGDNSGGWTYGLGGGGRGGASDPSNTQFAVLGLREAVEAGAIVSPETWKRARAYWERAQNFDGGWSYSDRGGQGASYGSMTVAGVASLVICEQMLRSDAGVAPDGTPPCCQGTEPNEALDRGIGWLAKSFAVGHNPGGANGWLLYYIYGVERAGRLSGLRFFGDHDWYREGAAYLVAMQNGVGGYWEGVGNVESHKVVGTSMALLFLAKGLSPVLINKLKYGPRDNRKGDVVGNDWNRHRRDVRNLVDLISGSPKWPKLLTSQDLDIARAVESGGVNTLLQAPVLFITGEEAPTFTPAEIKLLKEYLQEGGFIFATPTCSSAKFEAGFRAVVQEIMPPGEGELKRLTQDHPVFKSEHPLQAESTPLYGVDYGCRTSIMYSPEDLGCLWDYWSRVDPPNRIVNLKSRIIRATQVGVNVMAYATGREPPAKTDTPEIQKEDTALDNIERGLLQIAQIRHDGAWNAAPRALRRLLLAMNDTVSLAASTKSIELEMSDPQIFQYPILYMHGRNKFSVKDSDRQQIRKYLERGGVLFADSCCGSKPFDKSFREFVASLYRDQKLERITVDHELFSEKFGRDIRKLKRRVNEGAENAATSGFVIRDTEPLIEGLVVDGRLAVIYSKYDISCALERQSAGNCEGYLPEDAVKLATNIIQYAILEDLRLNSPDQPAKASAP